MKATYGKPDLKLLRLNIKDVIGLMSGFDDGSYDLEENPDEE